MPQIDRQDQTRYWKIREVRSAAHGFADRAEASFSERLAPVAGEAESSPGAAVGALFHNVGGLLDVAEGKLDQARLAREVAKNRLWRASREQATAYLGLRDHVCAVRRFADSQGVARGDLKVSGATPRQAEELARWGLILLCHLPHVELPDYARELAATLTGHLAELTRVLEAAVVTKQSAEEELAFANIYLRQVRREVDQEVAKLIRFLRTHLELVGEDYLSSRVLGKRRGRPRKSARARQEEPEAVKPDETARKESDSVRERTSAAGLKCDVAPQKTSQADRKHDSVAGQEAGKDSGGPREFAEAAGRASRACEEIEEAAGKACAASEKIAEASCKPCTAPSEGAEIVDFQQDTSKSVRRRRRRAGSGLLGASARWLSSGWMGRIVSKSGLSRRATERS